MKTSNRIFLVILITGLTALSILSITVYSINRSMVVKSNLKRSEIQAKELSYHLNRLLSEKINMVMMMATSRVILEALDMSNLSYAQIPDEKRDGLIKRQNSKWLSVNDPTDRFILKYTDNKVSGLLKAKQRTVEGEFGEIFLTNKFGALVASTSKLSTFAHGHKYWWLGAYGKGAVFIDDRGYDNSVGGYVLGLVIPIKKDGQISGLLKCNLNIMHSLRELIINTNCDPYSDFRLVRSGGLILFAQGVEPLKRRVNDAVALRLKKGDIKPFILRNSEGKYLVGLSEVELTKKNGKKYEFGGTFESADHKQGNRSESWFVLHYKSMSSIDSMLARAYKLVGFIGITLVIFLGLVSFWFSRKITGSLYALNMATEQIGMGNFEYRIPEQKNDEFGNLASSFNIMSSRLKETTTKVSTLNNEIVQRRRAEKELKGQRDLFELVINSVPARIFWKNLDLVYLGCNTNFAKDSGMETIANVIGT